MKKAASIIAFLFFILYSFGQKNDSMVVFTKRIEWSSFKGIPNNDTLVASISTSINLEVDNVNIWNGKIQFKSYALMKPYESWVKPGLADPYSLQHEQTHFNITEIYARKLQDDLNVMKIKSGKSPIIKITLDKWQRKMEEVQKQYDQETKGGNDFESQKIWNDKILAVLDASD